MAISLRRVVISTTTRSSTRPTQPRIAVGRRLVAQHSAEFGAPYLAAFAAVPEPASLSVLGLVRWRW